MVLVVSQLMHIRTRMDCKVRQELLVNGLADLKGSSRSRKVFSMLAILSPLRINNVTIA